MAARKEGKKGTQSKNLPLYKTIAAPHNRGNPGAAVPPRRKSYGYEQGEKQYETPKKNCFSL